MTYLDFDAGTKPRCSRCHIVMPDIARASVRLSCWHTEPHEHVVMAADFDGTTDPFCHAQIMCDFTDPAPGSHTPQSSPWFPQGAMHMIGTSPHATYLSLRLCLCASVMTRARSPALVHTQLKALTPLALF